MSSKNIKICIGSDHAGFDFKEAIKGFLIEQHYEVNDVGCYNKDAVDYPVIAFEVASAVSDNVKGILVCGSGSGMCITANKVKGIRAVNCTTSEMACLSVEHNDANVLCIGSRLLSLGVVKEIVRVFLSSDFSGGRHQLRVDKIHSITGI